MDEQIIRLMPMAERCALSFCSRRPLLDPDEMVAEAYFILCMMMLTGYSMANVTIDLESEDFRRHIKSRIYRDLGTYNRPTQAKAKTYNIQTLIDTGSSWSCPDYIVDRNGNVHDLPGSNFTVPVGEVLEVLIQTEPEMKVFNCYLNGEISDEAVTEKTGINVRVVAKIRNLLIDRLKHPSLEINHES